MDGVVKKKGANRPNRHGGASGATSKPQKQQSNAGKGFSKKGETESFRDGTLGDTVLAVRQPGMEHPSMQDSKQVLKVELQKLYISKENEKLVMDALKHAHGDEFELNDQSAYRDQGGGIMKQYWMSRSTLIVQGGIDYSNINKIQAAEGANQISAFALTKLESFGFHTPHCVEALTIHNGDVSQALQLLCSIYFKIEQKVCSFPESQESLPESILDSRREEKEALQAIYDNEFLERIENKVWCLRLSLPYLIKLCDKPEEKVVAKPTKQVCNFFLKGICRNSYNCRFAHVGLPKTTAVSDDHLKDPKEKSSIFEMEIRFSNGNMYPQEPPLICFSAESPKFPKDMSLKISKKLNEESKLLAVDGFPAIFSLVGILELEGEIAPLFTQPRPGPRHLEPLIPVEKVEEVTNAADASSKKTGQTAKAREVRLKSSKEILRENERLQKQHLDKPGFSQYKKMMEVRRTLPAWNEQDRILEALNSNQVIVVSGATGCGKSTQVPQFILDEWLGGKNFDPSSNRDIVCTQPRRLSAIGVAERVADERAEKIGQSVGYQIRLESKTSSSTRLLFCTTGILLRRLEGDAELASVSHIIVDEVHERSEESDFLLMILRDLLPKRRDLKVILMSATLNADLFSQYFGIVPILEIPGRTFPVEQLFLEDALGKTGYTIDESSQYARHIKLNNISDIKELDTAGSDDLELELTIVGDNFTPAHGKTPDEKLSPAQLFYRYENCDKQVCKTLLYMDPDKINYDLIEATLMYIAQGNHNYPRKGSILIFLPGMAEITSMFDQIKDHPVLGQRRGKFLLIPLHSALTSEEQALIFKKPNEGVRKIVMSTNIAETSITIDDCVFVIDAGKMKEKRYDPNKNMESLELCWVSQANALQRRGRAGRVMPGICFHLYTKHRYEWQLMKQPIPELQRVPLEQLVLKIKVLTLFKGREPLDVLMSTLEPPSEESVNTAIARLQDVGALDERANLTALGHHLAALPVDVRIGKLILLGAIFSCVDSALTMAACLSYKSPFVSPFAKRDEADKMKQQFATYNSDQLTVLRAYKGWLKARDAGFTAGLSYAQENFLSQRTLQMIVETKLQFLELLVSIGFVPSEDFNGFRVKKAAKMGRDVTLDCSGAKLNEHNENWKLLSSILCAALFPNVVKVLSPRQLYAVHAAGAIPRKPKPEELRFKTRDDGYVAIHPSSINYQVGLFSSPYLVFHEKIKTSRIFIRECSMVPALALVLLTGNSLHLELHSGMTVIALEGGWIRFGVDSHPVAEMYKGIRVELMKLLDKKIADPSFDFQSEVLSQHVIKAIIRLLTSES
ncbi:putative ATP-dependent RNA helicase DHX57 [Neocloeon triangulifer]|uniref:putative ATP-dependent RNA helicase DHX57 n=1 Tax=Neocloeon triangulifer TaxID=2078957 RepID=UPI00286EE5BB|nr:putative ATP-dependent RNA helicase DHX57 [Neocloeon triangulifer]